MQVTKGEPVMVHDGNSILNLPSCVPAAHPNLLEGM